ncbi:aminopeptidase [Candidatus Bathyarchaeota archaeon A05DMB-4]|jgi:leucyl aminopeptidase (aminopeptidase T)|nr:aminopeptidase [Candidatus Bathyarchaeota archaeon A05DMB-4]
MKAADVAAKQVLDIKKGEHVLIITNPEKDVYGIAQAMYVASLNVNASPVLMVQPKKTSFDYAEPAVIDAIKTVPNVIISISAERMGKDREALKNPYKGTNGKTYTHIFDYLLYEAKKIRAVWSPKTTFDMFVRTVPVNYDEMRKRCARIADQLQNANEVHVKTKLGTDVVIGVKGRKAKVDDGDFRTLGRGGNLPSGEVYISPQLGVSPGVIVFDGSITLDETVVIKTPVTVKIEKGFVTGIEGGKEAKMLEAYLAKAEEKPFEMAKNGEIDEKKAKELAKNARHIGELGIGTNPNARIIGNVLEDEKALGTVHFAIGSNYDHDAVALIHSDGIVKKPTITVDGKPLTL